MNSLSLAIPLMFKKINTFYHDLRFANAFFSVPLAYVGMLLALRDWPTWEQIMWISLAVLGARLFGQAVNQVADKDFDALHPHKRYRAIPSGLITVSEMSILGIVAGAIFLFAAAQLNVLALMLAPIVLLYLVFYAFTKRFTWATHLFMGATTGTAIAGGWVGVTGDISWSAAYLWMAAILWVAGFDLLLATLDHDFDIKYGLHSIVRNWGVVASIRLSKGLYFLSAMLFGFAGVIFDLSILYYPFWIAASGVLAMQHHIFDPLNFDGSQRIWLWSTAMFSVLLNVAVVFGLFF
ncbi:putative 4-hydroxybenzoate polyprenyltransferase [Dehalococcoidia bacterium]|nr:putative 4-hydroxybenzoate polyprenyltransferase [Dehalococcoidia bacterium]